MASRPFTVPLNSTWINLSIHRSINDPPPLQVHYVLDEIIMAGMVLETNIIHILQSVTDQTRLHSASQKALTPATKARTPTIGPTVGRMLSGR